MYSCVGKMDMYVWLCVLQLLYLNSKSLERKHEQIKDALTNTDELCCPLWTQVSLKGLREKKKKKPATFWFSEPGLLSL